LKTSNARVLATGFYLLEGPRWFNDELLVSDIYGKRVIRFTSPENGDFETWYEAGRFNHIKNFEICNILLYMFN